MSKTHIGSLKAQLDLSAPRLGTQVSGIGAQFQRMRGEVVSSVGAIHPALGTLTRALTGPAGLVGAGLAAATGVGVAFKKLMSESEEIVSAANRLKMGTEFLERMRHVADRTGTSFGTVTSAFQRMQIEISRAQGGGGRADFFTQLGLDPASLARAAPEDAFRILATAISQIENPIERARFQYELFGRSGVELEAVLQRVAGGMGDINVVSAKQRLILSDLENQWKDFYNNMAVRGKTGLAELYQHSREIYALITGGVRGLKEEVDAYSQRLDDLASSQRGSGQAGMEAHEEETRSLKSRSDMLARIQRQIDELREGADAMMVRDFVDAGGDWIDMQNAINQRDRLQETQRREEEAAARIRREEERRVQTIQQLRDEVERMWIGEEGWLTRGMDDEETEEVRRLIRERDALRKEQQARRQDVEAMLPGAALRGSREAHSAIVQAQRQNPQVVLQRQANQIAQDGFDRVERAVENIELDAAIAAAPNN